MTFGSPLDKIAFFFREYVPSEKIIRRKLLADTHTFRTSSLLQGTEGIEDPDPFFIFPEVRWLNFWHPKDLLSGNLDLYDLSAVPPKHLEHVRKNGNIRIKAEMSFLTAHGCYWGAQQGKGTSEMHDAIIREFF